jgi:hypothetical protein
MPADGMTAAHHLHTVASAPPFTGQVAHSLCRQIEIVPAIFISILRESHLPFSKDDYDSNRPHTSLTTEFASRQMKP